MHVKFRKIVIRGVQETSNSGTGTERQAYKRNGTQEEGKKKKGD